MSDPFMDAMFYLAILSYAVGAAALLYALLRLLDAVTSDSRRDQ